MTLRHRHFLTELLIESEHKGRLKLLIICTSSKTSKVIGLHIGKAMLFISNYQLGERLLLNCDVNKASTKDDLNSSV